MRSSNPVLSEKLWEKRVDGFADDTRMTIAGTCIKSVILLSILMVAAIFTWRGFMRGGGEFQNIMPWFWGGLIGGLLLSIVIIMAPKTSPFVAPLYAGAEGLFLGGLSAWVETMYPGIVIQAVGLTFGIFLIMLLLYTSRTIRVTPKFMVAVLAATGAVFMVYMASWIMGMFGVSIPYIHEGGIIGIGFSLVVIVIAALNLILDFHIIEKGAEEGAPKWYEWYGSFALMVTLVWLYIELLHLLMKLQSRD